MNNTIYALSTINGKSGVAVFRISGKNALNAVSLMTDIDINITPRHAYLTELYHSQTKQVLDKVLVLYFKAPHSFTGEDIVEFHTHGSKAVLNSVLESLSLIDDFRLAEPGEFSKRAFLNSKMDLTEAEGLADLIDAETSMQQQYALKQMSGNLKNLYESWRQQILGVHAYMEAYIDFPDEDIPQDIIAKNLNTVFKIKNEIQNHLKNSKSGERLRDGFKVVITGPTNAGKSSLINALTDRYAVIVSDTPGTTRDAIDIYLDIKGYPVVLTDTAGLRKTSDDIEKQGIEIARQKINNADFVLAVFDASKGDKQIFKELENTDQNKIIYLANKADLLDNEQCSKFKNEGCFLISAKTKTGLTELLNVLADKIQNTIGSNTSALITRARYREALNDCLKNLDAFDFDKPIELAAEDIRLAARAIGKITGRIEVDEILDKIFSSFCIGK